MNPKGVTIKGLWIKVFVKALPKINLSDKFLIQNSLQRGTTHRHFLSLYLYISS